MSRGCPPRVPAAVAEDTWDRLWAELGRRPTQREYRQALGVSKNTAIRYLRRIDTHCRQRGHYYGLADRRARCVRCGFERGGLAARLVAVQPTPRVIVPSNPSYAVYVPARGSLALSLLGKDRAL